MTYKDKLITLLKSDDEIKNEIEKLELGTRLKYEDDICILLNKTDFWDYRVTKKIGFVSFDTIIKKDDNFKIIWLPLQERFIRMYCRNKFSNLITNSWWEIANPYNFTIIETDNLKDFDSQSEEVYQKIYETLFSL